MKIKTIAYNGIQLAVCMVLIDTFSIVWLRMEKNIFYSLQNFW